MIKAPRHDFAITGTDPPAHEVIATPELQAWADAAAQRLAAGGGHVPADLEVVSDDKESEKRAVDFKHLFHLLCHWRWFCCHI
jgi:hypothetical protein